MSKLPFKERAKQQREQEILHQARRLIIEKGYANLNMDELAEAVGISKPTLYNHFSSKEDLVVGAIKLDMEDAEALLAAPYDGYPLDRITEVLVQMMRSRHEMGSMLGGQSGPEIVVIMHSNDELIAQRQRVHNRLADLVEAAKAQGQIVSHIDTQIIVRSMISVRWLVKSVDEDTLEKVIDQVIYLFKHGITPH